MQQGGAVEAAFAPKGNTQLIPNSYQMSKGSLELVPALVPKTAAQSGASFASREYAAPGRLATLPDGEYTGADLWRILFGLQPGDQLTFPQIYGEGIAQALTGAGGVYLDKTLFTDFCAPRIVLLESPAEVTKVEIDHTGAVSDAFVSVMMEWVDVDNSWYPVDDILGEIELNVENNVYVAEITSAYDDVFAINNDDPLRAIGCIRSHKDPSSRQWQYSTSNLVCIWQDGDRGIGDLNYFGFTLANAIDTYKKNVILDSDGNFLQRGTDDNIVPPSFQ